MFLLGDLDPLFGDEQELHQRLHIRLDAVGDTVKDFGKCLCHMGALIITYFRMKQAISASALHFLVGQTFI